MQEILNNSTYYILCGLVTGSLFFLMAATRELKEQKLEGLLYLTLSIFFASIHVFYLFNLPSDDVFYFTASDMTFWDWTVRILAPAVIALFVFLAAISFALGNIRAGLIKLFFGLTLLCYLYMLGTGWAADIRGILALLWCLIWFKVEIEYSGTIAV